MTITNTLLNETAKLLNNESAVIPGYLTISTDTALTSIGITDTTLSGEAGTRKALTKARSDNVLTLTGTRAATDISGASESIEAMGLFSGLATNDLFGGKILPSITHTTNFDVEFIFTVTVDRA